MSIVGFLVLAVIAAIAGGIGQALAGYSLGGCFISAIVGYIGALIGWFIARQFGLPEPFLIQIDGQPFPVLWSIIGSMLFALVLGLISRRRVAV